jgi:hypothetical protein
VRGAIKSSASIAVRVCAGLGAATPTMKDFAPRLQTVMLS